MSDNCDEIDVLNFDHGPYVVEQESSEWITMVQDLDEMFYDLRIQHSEAMYEIALEQDRTVRQNAFENQIVWFERELRTTIRHWSSHQRINFYVYFDNLRHITMGAMEPWELDFARICK